MSRSSKPSRLRNTDGKIGCLAKTAIVIVAVVAFVSIRGFIADWRADREERQELRNLADAEQDLRSFAEEHLPELQRVINDYENEIDRRDDMLDSLHADMTRLNRDPQADPQYQRWRQAVQDMNRELRQLNEERADAFLAFRKFELNPDSSDDAETRTRRFQRARAAAAEGRATFEELLRQAEAPNSNR